MIISDIQRRILELSGNKAYGFVVTCYPGGVIECTLPAFGYEHDVEPVVSEVLGHYGYTIEEFVKAVEAELGGKHLYKVGIDYTGLGRHAVVIYYHDDPTDNVTHSLITPIYPGGEFDTDNPQAKDLIERILNR